MCERSSANLRYPKGATENHRKELKRKHDAFLINLIPNFYSCEFSAKVFNSHWRDNSTLFDFLNVFTEHAKTFPLRKKIEVEEKTGALANYIHRNAKKFE